MEQLIDEIEQYAKACGLHPSTVLQRATAAGGGVWQKWKTGRGACSLKTADRLRRYMRDNPSTEPQGDAA